MSSACRRRSNAVSFTSTCKFRCRDWPPEIPHTGDTWRACVFFCVVRSAISQWWAGRGHRKVRRYPVWPVRSTSFSPPPVGLTSPVVVLKITYWRLPLWLRSPLKHTRYLLFHSTLPRTSLSLPATAKTSPKPWLKTTTPRWKWRSAADSTPLWRCSSPRC